MRNDTFMPLPRVDFRTRKDAERYEQRMRDIEALAERALAEHRKSKGVIQFGRAA